VLDRLAAEYGGKVKVGKVNVDEQQVLAGAFQIRGIPPLVVVRGGACTSRKRRAARYYCRALRRNAFPTHGWMR
jgi:thiol-disulfide isomerase/thioredoxin